jgi:hypothetical protein
MPTIRAPHTRENHYFRMLRATAQDRALSWRARGILAYLLSKPDGWECQEEDLIAEGGEGKHAVRVALAELKTAGYLTIAREHDPSTGAFRWVKTLHESPVTPDEQPATTRKSGDGPLPENRAMVKAATTRKSGDGPLPDLPSMVNQPIHIRESQERREEKVRTHPPPLPPAPPEPDGWVDGRPPSAISTPPDPITNLETVALLRALGVVSIAKLAHLPPAQVAGVIAAARRKPEILDTASWVVAQLRKAPTIDPADTAALERWLAALTPEVPHGPHSARRSAARSPEPPSQPPPRGAPRAALPHEMEERFRRREREAAAREGGGDAPS